MAVLFANQVSPWNQENKAEFMVRRITEKSSTERTNHTRLGRARVRAKAPNEVNLDFVLVRRF